MGSEKDRANQAKHGLSFKEAELLFTTRADYLEIYDAEHSTDEDRFLAIGSIERGVICVVFTEPEHDVIGIISARRATRPEESLFRDRLGKARP